MTLVVMEETGEVACTCNKSCHQKIGIQISILRELDFI